MRGSVNEIVCARVVRQQRQRERERAEGAGALQELAPTDAAVAVLVVELEDALVNLNLTDGSHCSSMGVDPPHII